MPKTTKPTSALRFPLDQILGTRSAVAVLRALSQADIPLSQAELARRTELHLRGIPDTLALLETAGLVTYVGRGRSRQVRINGRHPLSGNLRGLFQEEVNRWNSLTQGLRSAARHAANNGLIAAWVEGSVSERRDKFDDPVEATFIFDVRPSSAALESLRQQANNLQAQHHISIAMRYHQRADLLRFTKQRRNALEVAIPLFGPSPASLLLAAGIEPSEGSKTPSPRHLPGAEAVARQLVRDPEIVQRAREHIDRRMEIAGETERLVLLEWKGLLESQTPGQLARLLREETERAARLRQSLPFVDALTPKLVRRRK